MFDINSTEYKSRKLKIFIYTCLISLASLFISGCGKKVDLANLSDAYHTVSGEHLNFSKNLKNNNQNKWLIVNYWATWCAPCRKEINEINQFKAKHLDNAYIVGVSLEPLTPQALTKAIKSLNIQYPIVQSDLLNQWLEIETQAYPTTYVINPKGELVKTFVGPVKEEDLNNIIA